LEDLAHLPPELREYYLHGANCDSLPNAYGEFGRCVTNPIPVNGLIGTFKYLAKLHLPLPNGYGLYFHRVCSASTPSGSQFSNFVDVYETVSIDASHWDVVFLHMYHPRRSNLCPSGYVLAPYNKKIGDLLYCYGTNNQLPDFPYDLPAALQTHGALPSFVRRCRENLAARRFARPPAHLERLRDLRVKAETVPLFCPESGITLLQAPQKKS